MVSGPSLRGEFEHILYNARRHPQNGSLYLLTGPAFGVSENNPLTGYKQQVAISQLGPALGNPAIAIPNLIWNAGFCVFQNGTVQSFAVVGNNLPDSTRMFTQQITVVQMLTILWLDVGNQGQNIGGPNVDLFPGNVACSTVTNNLPNLPP